MMEERPPIQLPPDLLRSDALCYAHDENDAPCRRERLPGLLICAPCLVRFKRPCRGGLEG